MDNEIKWSNPNFKGDLKKRNNKENDIKKINVTNNIENENKEFIDLNTLLSQDQNVQQTVQIELIEIGNFAKITQVPRTIQLTPEQVGNTIIKYENTIKNKKIM